MSAPPHGIPAAKSMPSLPSAPPTPGAGSSGSRPGQLGSIDASPAATQKKRQPDLEWNLSAQIKAYYCAQTRRTPFPPSHGSACSHASCFPLRLLRG